MVLYARCHLTLESVVTDLLPKLSVTDLLILLQTWPRTERAALSLRVSQHPDKVSLVTSNCSNPTRQERIQTRSVNPPCLCSSGDCSPPNVFHVLYRNCSLILTGRFHVLNRGSSLIWLPSYLVETTHSYIYVSDSPLGKEKDSAIDFEL